LTERNENLYFTKFLEIFDANLELFKTCHVVIMERQLAICYKPARVSQHILTYLMIHLKDLPHFPLLFEINSTLKTRQFGKKYLNKLGVKVWSIEFALDILMSRNDQYALSIINKKGLRKKDDLADVVTQIEAFFSFMKWPTNSQILASKPIINIHRPITTPKINIHSSSHSLTASVINDSISKPISLNIIRN
jgi:hypothetical protein